MKKQLSAFFLLTWLLATNAFAQYENWEISASSKEIKKVYTYKNSATYVIYKTDGFGVFNHKTKEYKHFNKLNSPLKSNNINSIAVTDDSTVYVATNDKGLIKIKDGIYTNINFSETPDWTSDNVTTLAISPAGDIWLSDGGFNVYQITSTEIITHPSKNGATIGSFSQIKFLPGNKIWAIGTWGIANYDGSNWFEHKPYFPTSYFAVEADNEGNVWVSSGKGLLKYSGNSWNLFPDNDIYPFADDNLYLDKNGNPTVQDFSDWSTLNKSNNSWSQINLKPATPSYQSFILNNNDNLWVTTNTGFTLESPAGNTTFPYKQGFSMKGEPKDFLEDSHGNFWIGTRSEGLIRINNNDTTVYNYSGGFTDSQVYCLAEDKDGKVWIGGPNRLHYFLNDSIYEVKDTAVNYFSINDIFVDDDNSLWFAGYQKLYHFKDGVKKIYTSDNSLMPSEDLKHIEADKNGNLVISLNSGLLTFDKKDQWFYYTKENSGLGSTYVNSITRDAFGNIWVAGSNFGDSALSVWDGKEFNAFDIDPESSIQLYLQDIIIDKYGNKWIATQNHGLVRYDGNKVEIFNEKNSGLPTNYIRKLYYRKNGDLVLGYSEMLVIYKDPHTYLDTTNVRGLVFNDANSNGSKDADEVVIPFSKLKIWGSSKEIYADGNGQFSVSLKKGDYLIQSAEEDKWKINTIVIPVKVTEASLVNVSVPFTKVKAILNTSVSITGGFPRCNRDVTHFLEIRNDGTENQKAKVKLITTSNVVSNFPEPVNTSGDTLTWELNDLKPGEVRQFRSTITMPGFDGIFEAIAVADFYDAEGKPAGKRTDTLRPVIRCSYDPNDKSTIPAGLDDKKYVLTSKSIDYLIRFQNTGNDTAFSITVADTLSPLLDYSSFQLVSASHKVIVDRQDSLVLFRFKDILLPDSTVNEAASHGFVRFRVKPAADVKENMELKNTAYIYFDFNPAIVTNTTTNTLVSQYPSITGVSPVYTTEDAATIYPVPAEEMLTISLNDEPQGNLFVYSVSGKLIEEKNVNSKKIELETSEYSRGVYLIKIKTAGGEFVRKFVR